MPRVADDDERFDRLRIGLLRANHAKRQLGDGIALGKEVAGDSRIELLKAVQYRCCFNLATVSFLAGF
jgi:hypothetical protein